MTLREILKEGVSVLESAGIAEYELDAWLLLSYVTGVSRAYYYAHMDEPVSDEKKEEFINCLSLRSEHVPVQHITHQAFFMGYEFYVDENVLIPRQDTEILAERCLAALEGKNNPRILDMCTGSGCILTSLLLEIPGAEGTGADISEGALRVAEKNAERLGTIGRSRFIKSDLFSASFFDKIYRHSEEKYDILVSNPPYIRTGVIDSLSQEVRDHDPRNALDGGEDGLFFYRQIIREAPRYLVPGGNLLFEIGFDQAQEVGDLFREAGFTDVRITRDLSGLCRTAEARCASVRNGF